MPRYDPLIEVSARRNLYALPRGERDKLRRVLKDVARTEQPSHHPKAKQLQNCGSLFRVRAGDIRAVCSLSKPNLLIHRVGRRSEVYRNVDDVAEAVASV